MRSGRSGMPTLVSYMDQQTTGARALPRGGRTARSVAEAAFADDPIAVARFDTDAIPTFYTDAIPKPRKTPEKVMNDNCRDCCQPVERTQGIHRQAGCHPGLYACRTVQAYPRGTASPSQAAYGLPPSDPVREEAQIARSPILRNRPIWTLNSPRNSWPSSSRKSSSTTNVTNPDGALVSSSHCHSWWKNIMAMKIRLARGGSKKRPYYAIVAADSRMPRDGRFIDEAEPTRPCCRRTARTA